MNKDGFFKIFNLLIHSSEGIAAIVVQMHPGELWVSKQRVHIVLEATGQAGLEAVFQVPMPGDSGSSPNAGSIFKLLLDPGDFSLQPQRNPTSSLTPPSG